MRSVILNSPLAKAPPRKVLKFMINRSLKRLEGKSKTKDEIKALFDEAGGWGRGLVLNVTGVGEYHFTCNGNTEFYWLKDCPLVPFPEPTKDVDKRIGIQKTGNFANCEIILPYKTFLLMIGKEIGPMNAAKKGLATVNDYDGSGTLFHATVLMKFFENLRSSVGL